MAVDVDGRVLVAQVCGPEHIGKVAMGRHGSRLRGGSTCDRLTGARPRGSADGPGGQPPSPVGRCQPLRVALPASPFASNRAVLKGFVQLSGEARWTCRRFLLRFKTP